MKVHVYAWFGQPLPEDLPAGVQEVSMERIFKLFEEGHDVMLKHVRPPTQTKKERARQGELPDGIPLLALDLRYGGFRQR